MGQSFRRPAFTEEQLYDYQDCTYFTRNEILRLYRRFCSLRPGTIDRRAADVSTRLSFLDVQAMPELRYNPFKVSLYLTPFLYADHAHGVCMVLTRRYKAKWLRTMKNHMW